jgi:hypothetical protein
VDELAGRYQSCAPGDEWSAGLLPTFSRGRPRLGTASCVATQMHPWGHVAWGTETMIAAASRFPRHTRDPASQRPRNPSAACNLRYPYHFSMLALHTASSSLRFHSSSSLSASCPSLSHTKRNPSPSGISHSIDCRTQPRRYRNDNELSQCQCQDVKRSNGDD